jgi:hypothetical protein
VAGVLSAPGSFYVSPLKSILAKFTEWHHWSKRFDLPVHLPGVYMLGQFQRRPPPGKPQLSGRIFYIGETCGQTLRGRLNQFHRSGFLSKEGHSGGSTFYKTFKPEQDPKWLFVSVLAIEQPEPHSSVYIRFAERALLWSYVQSYGQLPSCNRK